MPAALLGGLVCSHAATRGGGPGALDESARRLSHEELAVARQLVEEGHRVQSRAERRGQGATSDLWVCGEPVEVKAFLPLSERGWSPSARAVCNKLADAARQAPTAVLWARGSGLDEVTARRGVRAFAQRGGFDRLSAVRVLGDSFDLTWGTPSRTVASPTATRGHIGAESPAPASGPAPGYALTPHARGRGWGLGE